MDADTQYQHMDRCNRGHKGLLNDLLNTTLPPLDTHSHPSVVTFPSTTNNVTKQNLSIFQDTSGRQRQKTQTKTCTTKQPNAYKSHREMSDGCSKTWGGGSPHSMCTYR